MRKGDAQGLDGLRMRPIASMLANSAFAASILSGCKRQARAWIGGPLVGYCILPCARWMPV